MDIEKQKIRLLGDAHIDRLKREEKEEEERRTNIISLEVKDRQHLLDMSKKEMENIKAKIPYYEHLYAEVLCIKNGIEDCTKSKYAFFGEEKFFFKFFFLRK